MKKSVLIVTALAAVMFSGCASYQLKRKLDEKMALEPRTIQQSDVQSESEQLLKNTRGFSEKQKSELVSLRDSVRAEMKDLDQQSLKLRSILIQDIVAPAYNVGEVDLIRDRLHEIENRRLNAVFHAVRKAEAILGRDIVRSQNVFDGFMFGGFPSGQIF
jgi:DNA primase